ncbi:MAG: hypothetical protein WCI51_20760 [Lentisphaerota bacterium]
MKKYTLTLSFMALCFVLICSSGCNSAGTGVAPSTMPITTDDTYSVIGPAQGRSFAVILYILPVSEKKPAGLARDRAIASSGGNALIECTETYNQCCLIFVTLIWTTCDGTAVRVERKAEQINK